MAIKYYCGLDMLASIDLNQNQLVKPRIENLGSDPSGVEGQIYYNTTSDVLRLYTGAGWVSLAAAGGVTTFSNAFGTYVSGTANSSATGAVSMGTIDLSAVDGTATSGTRFLTKDNKWAVPSDAGITSITLASDGDATSGNTITSNGTLTLSFDGTSSQYVDGAGDLVTFPTIPTVNNGTLSITAGNGLSGSNFTFTANQSGNTSATLAIGSGAGIQVNSTNVAVDYAGTDNVILSAADGTGVTLADADDIIFSDATDNGVKYANLSQLKTYIGGDNYGSWTIAGDSGSSTVSSGQTVTIVGSGAGVNAGIDTAESGRTVTVSLDLNEITTITSVASTAELIVNSSGNKKIDIDDIHLNQFGAAEADVNFGTNKLLNVKTGTASTDGVNLGQVQSLIAGVGQFKGGYNADTGLTTDLGAGNGSLDGASNIALDLGDFFVVTTGGTAFYSETLEVGDLIFANQDITASSNPAQTVYTVVIQDENIAGEGSTDGGTQKGVAGFNSAHFSVTANGWVSADIYGGGSTLGIVPSGGSAGKYLDGTGAWVTVPAGDVTGIDAGDGIRIDDGSTATPEVNVQYTGTNNVVVKAANAEGTDIAAGDLIIYADSSASDAVKRGLVSDLPFAPSSVTTGVTSVGLSAPSAFTVSGSPVTGSGTLAFTGAGTTAQYVDGTGSLQTFPSIPQGDVTKVIPSTANAKLGISVDNQGGPIPEVGLSIGTLADIGVSSNLDDADEFPFLDESVTTNKKVTLRELKDYITDSQSYAVTLTSPSAGSETVTHNLGSYDVIVQLYGDTSKETIYACVDRTSTNALSITFDSSVGQDVRVLVSRVTNE